MPNNRLYNIAQNTNITTLKAMANNGDAEAQSILGNCLFQGRGSGTILLKSRILVEKKQQNKEMLRLNST